MVTHNQYGLFELVTFNQRTGIKLELQYKQLYQPLASLKREDTNVSLLPSPYMSVRFHVGATDKMKVLK